MSQSTGRSLLSPTRVYGWLCLLDQLGGDEFSSEEERLAGILAGQVGRIYENGSMYVEVLRHTVELERELAERNQSDAELTLRADRFRATLASAPDGIITVDQVGHIRDINPAAERIFGCQAAQVLGKPLDLIFPPSLWARVQSEFAHALAAEETTMVGKSLALTGMRADGTEFPIELRVASFRVHDQTMLSAFIRDLSAGEHTA